MKNRTIQCFLLFKIEIILYYRSCPIYTLHRVPLSHFSWLWCPYETWRNYSWYNTNGCTRLLALGDHLGGGRKVGSVLTSSVLMNVVCHFGQIAQPVSFEINELCCVILMPFYHSHKNCLKELCIREDNLYTVPSFLLCGYKLGSNWFWSILLCWVESTSCLDDLDWFPLPQDFHFFLLQENHIPIFIFFMPTR